MIDWFWLGLVAITAVVVSRYLHLLYVHQLEKEINELERGTVSIEAETVSLKIASRRLDLAAWQELRACARLYVLAAEGLKEDADEKHDYAFNRLSEAASHMGIELEWAELDALVEGELQRLRLDIAAAANGARIG